METILKYFAIPFNTPTYGLKQNTKCYNYNRIIAIGEIVAEELQDPNSEASMFLYSLGKSSTCSSTSSYSYVVRYKPKKDLKNNLEYPFL